MGDRDLPFESMLDRARRGDAAALGELLNGHRDHLRRIAAGLLDPRLAGRLDTSDLVQQTCLSVHKRIAEFDGTDPAQFAAWLRKSHERNVRTAARDHLRAAKRAAGRERPRAGDDFAAAGDSSPSRRAIRSERAARIREAIDRLPEDEREALRLRYLDGLSLAEVVDRTASAATPCCG